MRPIPRPTTADETLGGPIQTSELYPQWQARRASSGRYNVVPGATVEGRFGMSWTTDLETARQFGFDGTRGRSQGAVYAATIEPPGLLAYMDRTWTKCAPAKSTT
jgi:hypothetical protein